MTDTPQQQTPTVSDDDPITPWQQREIIQWMEVFVRSPLANYMNAPSPNPSVRGPHWETVRELRDRLHALLDYAFNNVLIDLPDDPNGTVGGNGSPVEPAPLADKNLYP